MHFCATIPRPLFTSYTSGAFMNLGFVYVLIVALGFGGWPQLARFSGLTSAWSTTILIITTAVTVLAAQWNTLSTDPAPTTRGVGIVIVGGLANSLAMYLFGAKLMTHQPQLIPVAQVLMPVVTVLLGYAFFSDPLPLRHIVGIGVVAVGMYLMST